MLLEQGGGAGKRGADGFPREVVSESRARAWASDTREAGPDGSEVPETHAPHTATP